MLRVINELPESKLNFIINDENATFVNFNKKSVVAYHWR